MPLFFRVLPRSSFYRHSRIVIAGLEIVERGLGILKLAATATQDRFVTLFPEDEASENILFYFS